MPGEPRGASRVEARRGRRARTRPCARRGNRRRTARAGAAAAKAERQEQTAAHAANGRSDGAGAIASRIMGLIVIDGGSRPQCEASRIVDEHRMLRRRNDRRGSTRRRRRGVLEFRACPAQRASRARGRRARGCRTSTQASGGRDGTTQAAPLVGVVMGSDSDWDIMRHAAAQLDAFGIAYEPRVVSAHRMPDDMFEYAEDAGPRGLRCIIAGAGGAAHLPGMLAAKTTVPVLGVPVPSQVSARRGFAAFDRADAQGHAGRDVRHRRGGRRERGAVRGGDARRRPIPAVAQASSPRSASKQTDARARDARSAGRREPDAAGRRAAIRPDRARRMARAARRRAARPDVLHGRAEPGLSRRGARPGRRQPRRQRRRPAHPRRLSRPGGLARAAPRSWPRATTEFENVPAAALEFLAATRARHAGGGQRRHRAGPHPRKDVPRRPRLRGRAVRRAAQATPTPPRSTRRCCRAS